MNDDLKWVLGISVSGFFFLCGWMWWMLQQLNKKVSYEWIQTQFKADMQKEIKIVTDTLKDIRDALVGSMDNEGIVGRLRNIEKNCLKHNKELMEKI